MITEKELELFEKKIQDTRQRLTQGEKILREMVRHVKNSNNSVERNIDDWSDYGAWDNWDRG